MVADSIEARLRNWARVVRCEIVRHSCGSAEGRYRPRYPDEDPPVKQLLDIEDAWKIEAAWRSIDDAKSKSLLRRYYVDFDSPREISGDDAAFVIDHRRAIDYLFLALK